MAAETTNGDRRNQLGQAGEAAVRRHLAESGWSPVAHNVRWREGEIDIISLDGECLVFSEVKTLISRRGGRAPFSPFESITRQKQLRIRSLARRWLIDELRQLRQQQRLYFTAIRFDAFAVTVSVSGEIGEIEHVKDAF